MASAINVSLDNIGPWLAAAVVVLGWFYNNYKANERENRKDSREALSGIVTAVESLKKASITYHSNSAHVSQVAMEIKSLLTILGMRVTLLEFLDGTVAGSLVMGLRQHITSKNFDGPSRFVQYREGDPRLQLMIAECDLFVHALESAYVSYYFSKKKSSKR